MINNTSHHTNALWKEPMKVQLIIIVFEIFQKNHSLERSVFHIEEQVQRRAKIVTIKIHFTI